MQLPNKSGPPNINIMGEREKCVKPFVELCRGDCARLFQVGDQKGKGRGRHKVGR